MHQGGIKQYQDAWSPRRSPFWTAGVHGFHPYLVHRTPRSLYPQSSQTFQQHKTAEEKVYRTFKYDNTMTGGRDHPVFVLLIFGISRILPQKFFPTILQGIFMKYPDLLPESSYFEYDPLLKPYVEIIEFLQFLLGKNQQQLTTQQKSERKKTMIELIQKEVLPVINSQQLKTTPFPMKMELGKTLIPIYAKEPTAFQISSAKSVVDRLSNKYRESNVLKILRQFLSIKQRQLRKTSVFVWRK